MDSVGLRVEGFERKGKNEVDIEGMPVSELFSLPVADEGSATATEEQSRRSRLYFFDDYNLNCGGLCNSGP